MIVLYTTSGCSAQYSTSKTGMSFPVRNLPSNYVPEGRRTYSVSCGFARQISPYITPTEVAAQLQLDGWSMVSSPNDASLRIAVDAYDFLIEGIHEERFTETANFHGHLEHREFFTPVIDYSVIIEYAIDCNGNKQTYTNIDPFTRRAPISTFRMDKAFPNPRDCHEFVRENKEVFIEKIVRTEILATTAKMNEKLVPGFVYSPTTDNIKVAFFSSKKSPYYNKHQSGRSEVRQIVESIPLQGPLTDAIKRLQPWIEHFKEVEKSLSTADKKQKQAKADMVYNLAMIYYALEIFDVSRDYATRYANEFDATTGKRLLRNINNTESEMKRHQLQSRHF